MPGLAQHSLATLRERIAQIEKRPPLVGGAALRDVSAGSDSVPQALTAPAGLLQEVFADEQRDGAAAFGFALGLARGLITPRRPAVLFLQLSHEAGEQGLPYGPGLVSFGLDPEQLVVGRLAHMNELLWAVEEAVACGAVAAVVAEVLGAPPALDFTASRRLSLRAAGSGASVLLLRYTRQREASAARLRWRIAPAESQAPPFDARAPGRPRWRATLEKGRIGTHTAEAGLELWLDWTEHGFAAAQHREAGARQPGYVPAAPGAFPAALGDRLSQAG